MAVSSELSDRRELFRPAVVYRAEFSHVPMRKLKKKTTRKPAAKAPAPKRATAPAAKATSAPAAAKPGRKRGRRKGMLSGLGSHERERDILDQYLHGVSKTPLLTQKEEIALARKVRAGDQESMQELVKRNLRFVISVAKKYQNREIGRASCRERV